MDLNCGQFEGHAPQIGWGEAQWSARTGRASAHPGSTTSLSPLAPPTNLQLSDLQIREPQSECIADALLLPSCKEAETDTDTSCGAIVHAATPHFDFFEGSAIAAALKRSAREPCDWLGGESRPGPPPHTTEWREPASRNAAAAAATRRAMLRRLPTSGVDSTRLRSSSSTGTCAQGIEGAEWGAKQRAHRHLIPKQEARAREAAREAHERRGSRHKAEGKNSLPKHSTHNHKPWGNRSITSGFLGPLGHAQHPHTKSLPK